MHVEVAFDRPTLAIFGNLAKELADIAEEYRVCRSNSLIHIDAKELEMLKDQVEAMKASVDKLVDVVGAVVANQNKPVEAPDDPVLAAAIEGVNSATATLAATLTPAATEPYATEEVPVVADASSAS
jgi:hypothetical protein